MRPSSSSRRSSSSANNNGNSNNSNSSNSSHGSSQTSGGSGAGLSNSSRRASSQSASSIGNVSGPTSMLSYAISTAPTHSSASAASSSSFYSSSSSSTVVTASSSSSGINNRSSRLSSSLSNMNLNILSNSPRASFFNQTRFSTTPAHGTSPTSGQSNSMPASPVSYHHPQVSSSLSSTFSVLHHHHQQHSTNMDPPTLPPRAKSLPFLPNELILIVFDKVPTSSLLNCRAVSKRYQSLSEVTLLARLQNELVSLESRQSQAEEICRDAEREKRPHMRHYKGFLRNVSAQDIAEATWYTAPPEELKTVCECLCILKGVHQVEYQQQLQQKAAAMAAAANAAGNTSGTSSTHGAAQPMAIPGRRSAPSSLSSSPTVSTSFTSHITAQDDADPNNNPTSPTSTTYTQPNDNNLTAPAPPPTSQTPDPASSIPLTWSTLKKHMSRYDFKTWLTNLRVGVDHIPIAYAKRVEKIIMLDPNITYERLREVSTAGYKLLIVVAACLQYCTIAEELRGKRDEVVKVERKRRRYQAFVEVAKARSEGDLSVLEGLDREGVWDVSLGKDEQDLPALLVGRR